MIGIKLTSETYTQGALWCNRNKARINPKTWIIEKIPDPTEDELKNTNRNVRNLMLKESDEWVAPDRPQNEEVENHILWRSYLRDYTKSDEWWKESPLSYKQWKETKNAR